MEAHNVTSPVPVARIVGSRWMTEDFMLILHLPLNTIQKDIHPDIRPAGNSPAEYSAETYFYL